MKKRGVPKKTSQAVARPDMMKAREAAQYLKCDVNTIYRLARKGGLRAFRLGGDLRITRSDRLANSR